MKTWRHMWTGEVREESIRPGPLFNEVHDDSTPPSRGDALEELYGLAHSWIAVGADGMATQNPALRSAARTRLRCGRALRDLVEDQLAARAVIQRATSSPADTLLARFDSMSAAEVAEVSERMGSEHCCHYDSLYARALLTELTRIWSMEND